MGQVVWLSLTMVESKDRHTYTHHTLRREDKELRQAVSISASGPGTPSLRMTADV